MPRTTRPIRVPTRKSARTTSDSFRRLFSVSAGVFVFLGLVLSVLIWVPSMEAALAARAGAAPTRIAFQWPAAGPGPDTPASTDLRTWVPSPVRDELMSRVTTELDRFPDAFSIAGLRAASDSLMRTGWFDAPPLLRREGESVRIDGSWRTPAAVVRRNGVDYLIASGGELLPLAYQRGIAPVPAIVGAGHEPPGSGGQVAPGMVWAGDDIRAALDTIAIISPRAWRDQVVGIDVGEYASYKRLALLTKWNGKVVIGGAPRDTIPGEVALDMKLRRLDELHRQFGQIDAKHRLVEVAGPVMLVDDVTTASREP
jgi:hypothetical protein